MFACNIPTPLVPGVGSRPRLWIAHTSWLTKLTDLLFPRAGVMNVTAQQIRERKGTSEKMTTPKEPKATQVTPAPTHDPDTDKGRLTVQVSAAGFNPAKFELLQKMVAAKATLLREVFGATTLPIVHVGNSPEFQEWFSATDDTATIAAYQTFADQLCQAALTKTRVLGTDKGLSGSTKFAMRNFLLSLGFRGEEFEQPRNILLANLEGSPSWKYAKPQRESGSRSPSERQLNKLRATYPPGTRVELVLMADPHAALQPGSQGTVTEVDTAGSVFVDWDNGTNLAAVYKLDQIKAISPITPAIAEQIRAVRETGKTNMLDVNTVEQVAQDLELTELVGFLETYGTSIASTFSTVMFYKI